MKLVVRFLRCVLVAFLLLWILALAGCSGIALVDVLRVFSKEQYAHVDAMVVNPALEGKRVQLKAPAYTDEWLELRDIGVRMQALRLNLRTASGRWQDNVWVKLDEYNGHPLKSHTAFARRIRMGAYELELSEDRVGASQAKLPFRELHLPENWVPHCTVSEEDAYELRLELAGEPPRTIECYMVENGRELIARGIQRGNRISPIHCIRDDERSFHHMDDAIREKAIRDAIMLVCVSFAIPALLIGVFRLFRWNAPGRSAPLAVWLMVALDAAAFLLCGGWKYTTWACVAGAFLLLVLCCVVRIVRGFGVDCEAK